MSEELRFVSWTDDGDIYVDVLVEARVRPWLIDAEIAQVLRRELDIALADLGKK